MTIMGQLQPGVVEIVKPGTNDVIGYAFTEESDGGQLQRWLLHERPQNNLEIRQPPTHMAGWTLARWKAEVPALWQPGSIYVRAQADVYHHGATYGGVTWGQIPTGLPDPSYPPGGGSTVQLDFRAGQQLNILQNDSLGLAFTDGHLDAQSSVEYWMLPGSYQAAGGGCSAVVSPGATPVNSLAEFIALANRSWGSGSRFVITGCHNYTGAAQPAVL